MVALFLTGEHEQVVALGICLTVLRTAQSERELSPEDRLHRGGLGRLGKPDDAVEAVVIGDRQSVQAEALRLFEQFLGRGGTVEEAVVGMRMEFGVRQGIRVAHDPRWRDIGPALE